MVEPSSEPPIRMVLASQRTDSTFEQIPVMFAYLLTGLRCSYKPHYSDFTDISSQDPAARLALAGKPIFEFSMHDTIYHVARRKDQRCLC